MASCTVCKLEFKDERALAQHKRCSKHKLKQMYPNIASRQERIEKVRDLLRKIIGNETMSISNVEYIFKQRHGVSAAALTSKNVRELLKEECEIIDDQIRRKPNENAQLQQNMNTIVPDQTQQANGGATVQMANNVTTQTTNKVQPRLRKRPNFAKPKFAAIVKEINETLLGPLSTTCTMFTGTSQTGRVLSSLITVLNEGSHNEKYGCPCGSCGTICESLSILLVHLKKHEEELTIPKPVSRGLIPAAVVKTQVAKGGHVQAPLTYTSQSGHIVTKPTEDDDNESEVSNHENDVESLVETMNTLTIDGTKTTTKDETAKLIAKINKLLKHALKPILSGVDNELNRRKTLSTLIAQVSTDEETTYMCPCSNCFASSNHLSNLLQHLRIHKKELKKGNPVKREKKLKKTSGEAILPTGGTNTEEQTRSITEKTSRSIPFYDISAKKNNIRRKTPEKSTISHTLPIVEHKLSIINAIKNNRVVIITGYTGCGKSTQIPQYILQSSRYCRVLCTQPRRLAAISLAKRVAQERGTEVGKEIGFSIGGNKNMDSTTRVTFMTTGCLTERILHNEESIGRFTHIIMDEVHERDVENDLLLNLMRRMLNIHPNLKLILMSATIDPEKFSTYFGTVEDSNGRTIEDIPQIFIKSGCYPVTEHYLEDMLDMLPPSDNRNYDKIMQYQRHPMISEARRNYMLDFILWKHQIDDKEHSYLIFLPGIADIDSLYEQIETRDKGQTTELHILHSIITTEEQELIFQPAPTGVRKILLATNIAESSITIPDCQVVIDFCLTKAMMWDSVSQCNSLNISWVSKDSAQQRKGRSGRVMPGELYRVVTSDEYEAFQTSVTPQIQREPLDRLVLRILQNPNWDHPKTVLSKRIFSKLTTIGECIDPPNLSNLGIAYEALRRMDAIIQLGDDEDDYEPTFKITDIGLLLASLPVDSHAAMLVMYGYAFGYLHECIALAGIIARGCPIITARDYTMYSAKIRYKFANGSNSDLIAGLFAYREYQLHREQHHENMFARRKWCLEHWLSSKTLREIDSMTFEIYRSLQRFEFSDHALGVDEKGKPLQDVVRDLNSSDVDLLKILIGAAYSTNMLSGVNKKSKTTLSGDFTPFNSISITNIAGDCGEGSITNFFETIQGGSGTVKAVVVNGNKATIEFDTTEPTKINQAVKLASRFKQQKGIIEGMGQKKKTLMIALHGDLKTEHSLIFERVVPCKTISVQLQPLFLSDRNITVGQDSILFPVVFEQPTNQHHVVTIVPVVLHGINNNSLYFANECTMLPPIPRLREMIIVLFACDNELQKDEKGFLVSKAGTVDDTTVVVPLSENHTKEVLELRNYLNQCKRLMSVRKSKTYSTKTEKDETYNPEAAERLLNMANASSRVVVPLQYKSENISIPEGSMKHVLGHGLRNKVLIEKDSGAKLSESIEHDLIMISYIHKDQLIKAKRLITKAINNQVIVFNHPKEAHVLITYPGNLEMNNMDITYKRYKLQGSNRLVYTLEAERSEQAYELTSDHMLCQVPVDDGTKNSVEFSLIRYQSAYVNHFALSRFASYISGMPVNTQVKGFAGTPTQVVKIGYHFGVQLFYQPKTAQEIIIGKEVRGFETRVPLPEFLSYRIGHGRNIKTTFLHDNSSIVEELEDYLRTKKRFKIASDNAVLVTVEFVDLKLKERFVVLLQLVNEQLEFIKYSSESDRIMFISYTKMNTVCNDSRLILSDSYCTVDLEDVAPKTRAMIKKLKWGKDGIDFDAVPMDRFSVDSVRYKVSSIYDDIDNPQLSIHVERVRENTVDFAVQTVEVQVKLKSNISSQLTKQSLDFIEKYLQEKVIKPSDEIMNKARGFK